MCLIKGDIFSLPRGTFVASASMMPEATTVSHGYSVLLGQWTVCRFLGGKSISDHYLHVTLQSTER
jgi:hypothetical protein